MENEAQVFNIILDHIADMQNAKKHGITKS